MRQVVGPPEPAHWEVGRYVTEWAPAVDHQGVTRWRRWVRTENGWDEETRDLWEGVN